MTVNDQDATWQELVSAATHKLDIAEIRHRRLLEQLDQYADDFPPAVPLDVQEPFEGLLTAVVAAKQQLTDAILTAHGQSTDVDDRGRAVLRYLRAHHSSELEEAIRAWNSQPIVGDLTDIRNLAVHGAYEKRLRDGRWHVQEPRDGIDPYKPRDLKSYAIAVNDHAESLRNIIEHLTEELTKDEARRAPSQPESTVVHENGTQFIEWTDKSRNGNETTIRYEASDMVQHFYQPTAPDQDITLYAGKFTFDGDDPDRPYEGHVRFTWQPTPRVVAEGSRPFHPDDFAGLVGETGPSWVTAPTIQLVGQGPGIPSPPAVQPGPPERAGGVTALSEQRLGDQTLGEPRGLEKVTFLVAGGWRAHDGRRICNPANRRQIWQGRLTASGGGWNVTVDSLPHAAGSAFWKEQKVKGGHAFTHVGELTRDGQASFDGDHAQDVLDALRVSLSFAVGRSTAGLLPVGWVDDEPRWTTWRTPPVDRIGSGDGWVDPLTANAQISELVGRVLDVWADPTIRDVVRYATSYYVTANVDVNAELIVAIAVSGLQLLGHDRFVTRGPYSNNQWKNDLNTEGQLRLLLEDGQIPTAIPDHFDYLQAVAARIAEDDDAEADALSCVVRLRNQVVHPTRDRRSNWSIYQWAEAGFAALYFLERALLNRLEYSGVTRSRLRGPGDDRAGAVPWA